MNESEQNKTIIEIDDNHIVYKKIDNAKTSSHSYIILIFIIIFIFVISVVYSLLYHFEWSYLITLQKYKKIKKYMNSWFDVIDAKTDEESKKGRLLALSKVGVTDFKCRDFGNSYAPIRLTPSTYLVQSIRRGNSGPWLVAKAEDQDEAAKQFCEFLIYKYSTTNINASKNYITCGNDMFEKIGYSGYFTTNPPCESGLEIIISES